MIIAVTGHRPQRLGQYREERLKDLAVGARRVEEAYSKLSAFDEALYALHSAREHGAGNNMGSYGREMAKLGEKELVRRVNEAASEFTAVDCLIVRVFRWRVG